jgi:hypothetical protein
MIKKIRDGEHLIDWFSPIGIIGFILLVLVFYLAR